MATGILLLGNNDALCTTAPLQMLYNGGTLNLGGFNQTLPSVNTTNGTKIGSSSTTADSVLTINDPAVVSVIRIPHFG